MNERTDLLYAALATLDYFFQALRLPESIMNVIQVGMGFLYLLGVVLVFRGAPLKPIEDFLYPYRIPLRIIHAVSMFQYLQRILPVVYIWFIASEVDLLSTGIQAFSVLTMVVVLINRIRL